MKHKITFKKLIKLTDEIIENKQSYGLAKISTNFKIMEDFVINSKNANWAYMFAHRYSLKNENVQKFCKKFGLKSSIANIRELGNLVLKYGDNDLNFRFAGIIGADFKAHENFILKKGSLRYNYEFIKCYENANIDAHKNVLIKKLNSKLSTKQHKEEAKHYLDLLENNKVEEIDKFFEM